MKYLFILLLFFAGCKKEAECKLVTEMIVNGYTNQTTYPLQDVRMCGADLTAIRKLNNTYHDIHIDNRTFRITTFIIEK